MGVELPPVAVAAAVVADGDDEVELELLLPQPAASAESAIAIGAAHKRRLRATPITTIGLLVLTPESWHPTGIMAIPGRSALRGRRLECGLTQAELAARAGVSRQLVAAVEAGHNMPAVDAALGLARALASTVEELFASVPEAVVAALGDRLPDGAPLRIGRVDEQLVAAELPDHATAGASWANPDGVIEAGKLRMFDGATPAGVVLAGCDPALGVAEAMLGGLGSRSLLAISAPTGTAVRALERGRVHGAVVHGIPNELADPPVPVIRWHLARWQVGLATALGVQSDSLEAILGGEVPIAQRDSAAASQQAFERASASAGIARPRPGPLASGHIDAARIAAIINGAAVTTEAAARAFGLAFLALEEHTVEIWLSARWLDHPGVRALGDLLTTTAFTARVGQFGGYDLSGCGTLIAAA